MRMGVSGAAGSSPHLLNFAASKAKFAPDTPMREAIFYLFLYSCFSRSTTSLTARGMQK
jgi:hypothetical protein